MDIRLPGIDGIEALRRLRADPATQAIPAMTMTASIMTAGPEEMQVVGFDGYQSKPLQVTTFVAQLEQLLENGRRWPWPYTVKGCAGFVRRAGQESREAAQRQVQGRAMSDVLLSGTVWPGGRR